MAKPDEAVNPKHYSDFGEHAAIIIVRRWNTLRKKLGLPPVDHNVMQSIKYLQRAGFKPGEDEVRDVAKAAWYLANRLHELDPANYPDPAKID